MWVEEAGGEAHHETGLSRELTSLLGKGTSERQRNESCRTPAGAEIQPISALRVSYSKDVSGSEFSQKRLLKRRPKRSSQKPHLKPEAFPLAILTPGKDKH